MPQKTAPFTSYQWLVLLVLVLTQFTVVLDFMVMSPLGDILMKSLRLTTTQFGAVVSSYALSAGVSGLLTAGFADRFDRKRLLLFFYTGFIVGTLFCGLANTYALLLGARIFTGIFGGVIGSISMAIVADLYAPDQRGRVVGLVQMGFGASQVLGIPISLYLANRWGWQSPFFMIVGLATAVWLVGLATLQPIREHLLVEGEKNAALHLLNTVKQPRYRVGFLATAFLSLGGFLMMPWGSTFAVNNLGITQAQLPFLFMIAGVSSLVFMPLVGILSDKVNRFWLFVCASIFLSVIVIVYTNMEAAPFWVVVLLNIGMMIGITSRMVPSMAISSELPAMHDRGAFMSISSSLQQISGGLAAAVGGMIVVQPDQFGPLERYDVLGYLVVGTSLLVLPLMFRVWKLVRVAVGARPTGSV